MAEFLALNLLHRPLTVSSKTDPQQRPQIPKLSFETFPGSLKLGSIFKYLHFYNLWFRKREKYADHFNKYGILHLAFI